jgi:hypothetical protein
MSYLQQSSNSDAVCASHDALSSMPEPQKILSGPVARRLRRLSMIALFIAVAALCLPMRANAQGFAAPSKYLTGGVGTTSVAAGDFNGDGNLDLIAANQNSYDLGLLLGNGDGTFQTALNYPVMSQPRSVAVGDLNGDGNLDVVVGSETGGDISLLAGNGDGTFQSPVSLGLVDRPEFILVKDLNADSKLDLAVASFGGFVHVFPGNGDGTVQAAVSYPTGMASISVDAADFNSDGKLDLAVANQNSNDFSILAGNGDGTFQPAVSYSSSGFPTSIKAAELNGDGQMDLVVGRFGLAPDYTGMVGVLLGNGDGTFNPAVDYTVGMGAYSLAVSDFDADGSTDVVVANDLSNSVSVLSNQGNGSFQVSGEYGVGNAFDPYQPYFVAAADFNKDGSPDIATANFADNSVSILLYTPPLSSPSAKAPKAHLKTKLHQKNK